MNDYEAFHSGQDAVTITHHYIRYDNKQQHHDDDDDDDNDDNDDVWSTAMMSVKKHQQLLSLETTHSELMPTLAVTSSQTHGPSS